MPTPIVWEDQDGNEHILDELFKIDELTGARIVMTYLHHEIHEGNMYLADFADDSMADAETINLVFKTPTGNKRAHMFMEFNTLVGGALELWEGVTWTTNTGAVAPIRNRDRSSKNTSILLEDLSSTPAFTRTSNILSNVTGLNTGSATLLHHLHAWGSKQVGGGSRADQNEFRLAPDTQYAALFTGDGASNKAQVILNWYEH